MKKLCLLISTTAFLLSGCGGHTTEEYAAQSPRLDIREFFNGPIEASGIVYSFTGKADLMFHAKMHGSWQGDKGTLEETFTYSDGRTDQRTWHIQMKDDHNFTATAGDVVGQSIGTQHGNTVNMRYVLDAKRSSGDSVKLSMDDWMYLVDSKSIINRIKMRKFGIAVGELVVTMRKP